MVYFPKFGTIFYTKQKEKGFQKMEFIGDYLSDNSFVAIKTYIFVKNKKTMIRFFSKFVYYILKSLVLLILGIIILFTIPYLRTQIYNFAEPKAFAGDKWYNPYDKMDPNAWHKANFQVQSYAWKGVTDGSENSNYAIDSIYSYLGYDIIATSDYMKINEYGKDKPQYLRVYEHGYNIKKRHLIAIGSRKVKWMDYFFFQNIHHKQHIINIIRPYNELIFLAHPDLSGSRGVEDFDRLTNYDGIEAHSIFGDAIDCWDMALSTGHYVTIQANDDSHNVFSPNLTGNYATVINAVDFRAEEIIKSMKEGNAYGVRLFRNQNEAWEVKKERHDELAKLINFEVKNDSLFVALDKISKETRFVGQNGEVKKEILNDSCFYYPLQNDDSYIRTEFEFSDSTLMFLNPVARTHFGKPAPVEIEGVNQGKTWLFRLFIIILEVFFIFVFVRIIKRGFALRKK